MNAEVLVYALADTLPELEAKTLFNTPVKVKAKALVDAVADTLAEVEKIRNPLAEVRARHCWMLWATCY